MPRFFRPRRFLISLYIRGGALVFSLLFFLFSVPVLSKPNHLVVGYSAVWFDGIYPPVSYNYGALTHILRAFLTPEPDGSIGEPGGFWNEDLEQLAHAHGVKLLASLGGAAPDADHWLKMARNPQAEKIFFDNLGNLVTVHHYDGVDVDWEPSALTDEDQATFTQFMKDLRARFPGWIITTALGASDYYGKHISWAEVAAQVDWINWMAYDFAGNWTGHSAHNANLFPPHDPKADGGTGVDQNLTLFEKKYKLPADKVVLGLPFYGIQFFSPHMGGDFTGEKEQQGKEIQFYEIAALLADKESYQTFWDGGSKSPYLEKKGGGFVVSYDNPKSIALKCDYALKQGLKGVMIWNLGADLEGDRTPLMDAVALAFGAEPMGMPKEGLAQSVENMGGILQDSFEKLQKDRERLGLAGKKEDALAADVGLAPDDVVPADADVNALGKKLWELQYFLSRCDRKLDDCQRILDNLPVKEVVGQEPPSGGRRILIDGFEGGGTTNAWGGTWTAECDHNNLGTVLNPSPFTPQAGGVKGSKKFAAHLYGHYGRSVAPWPYAELTGTLNSSGAAEDLSSFKTLEFWAKGDGKDYSVLFGRAAVQDYANPRLDFKAPTQWTKVVLNLADFKQPAWGRQVPPGLQDVLFLCFTPSSDFSDEDYDLWVDEIALLR